MRKVIVLIALFLSGIVLSAAFGLMIVLRMISIFQMNHVKAAR